MLFLNNFKVIIKKGIMSKVRTNLSIDDCDYNNDQYCARKPFLCSGVPCCDGGGVDVLNPELYVENAANDFVRVDKSACGRKGWTSEDARLKNPRTGNIPLVLDKRPLDMSVGEHDVYTQKCEDFKTGFTPYKDIKKGQITYYVDRDIAPPFTSPNFENCASVTGYNWVTPMNGIWPRYERKPLKCRNYLETDTCRCDYLGGLSWIEDSNEQRENIMASQMDKINRMKWESRWLQSLKE
jgi:hypothetical protein